MVYDVRCQMGFLLDELSLGSCLVTLLEASNP